MITGLFIIIEDSLAIDDYVDVGGHLGTVEGLTIRTVRLRDIDGDRAHHPVQRDQEHQELLRESSATRSSGWRSPYNMEIDNAIKLMREVGQKMRNDPLQRRNLFWGPAGDPGGGKFESRQRDPARRFKTAPIKQWEVSRAFEPVG